MAQMGRALWEQSAVFREAVSACEAALRPYTGWSMQRCCVVRKEMRCRRLGGWMWCSPRCSRWAWRLAAVWRSLGLHPDAVVGTSQGEVAAAVVAGALSLEDGARVVALRSQLLGPLAGTGGDGGCGVAGRGGRAATRRGGLSVAVVNTPTSTVVAGDRAAIERL